jgi:hypothetical protein
MIIAFVTFKPTIGREEALKKMEASMPVYQKIPGLIRKNYIATEDGQMGGVYLWESREKAEAFYDESWPARFEAYGPGVRPQLRWLECPFLVDNRAGEIVRSEAETMLA